MMTHRILPAFVVTTLLVVPVEPSQQTAPPPPPQQQQRPPVFRAGANLVQVDAYPTRDGRIAEGLTAEDFEVFEDGKRQAIEGFEFIRIEPNTPIADRIDPNTQEEGNRLAADPRNRVFVVYLDYYHLNITGSWRTRRPLVDMLNRLLTATDLFGVMTPILRPRDLILGRRTETLEEQLAKHWTWGGAGDYVEPDEEWLVACGMSGFPVDVGRRRQEKVFDSLDGLVNHLGALREARKVLLLFTRGWASYAPMQRGALRNPAIPQVGVDPGGRISTAPAPGRIDAARCNSEMMRLDAFDTDERVRLLLAAANRNNVSFYPVNPSGLEVPDVVTGGSMTRQWNSIRDRGQQLLTLAENTDGIAVNSNDMSADLRRIADDVSAYYVLSYYSTNTKMDGKYRRIEVRMKPAGVKVKARRGYGAPVAAAPSSAAPAGSPAAAPAGPSPVDEALATLSRLRPVSELFTYATAAPGELAVVVELPADRGLTGQWANGAEVEVSVTDGSGAALPPATTKIVPPSRGSLTRVPMPPTSTGPWSVAARVTDGTRTIVDRVEVAAAPGKLVGGPVLFRARPPASAPLQPVADYQFRRNERMHVDWPVLGPLDRREARVLGRNGSPLALPVTITERAVNGRPMVSIDLNLAPLTEADYIIELQVGQGSETERKLFAFRVIR